MAHGWTYPATGCAGNQPWQSAILIGGHTVTAAAGYGPTVAGIGTQITHGAGRHFIMVVGAVTRTMAGSGCRAPSGRRHGSPGVIRARIVAGHRCRQDAVTAAASGLPGMAAA